MDTTDRRLVLSNQLIQPPGGTGAMHFIVGRPLEVNEEAWKLLELFRKPATAAQAAATAAVRPDDLPVFFQWVERFVRTGFLVEPDEDRYLFKHGKALAAAAAPLLRPAASGLLGAAAESTGADIHFVGVPFEHPLTPSGSQLAPSALRTMSAMLSCFPDPRTGRCQGVRHLTDNRLLLAGALLCDRGDVHLPPWLSLEEAYEKIAAAARLVGESRGGGVPVFLGGDHSLTEPIVRGLANQPLFIVQFDAHTDLYPLFCDVTHHHGNFMERLRQQEAIRGILQVGVRDLQPPWWTPPAKTKQLGATQAARMGPSELLRHIPRNAACYITIDIDVLDPAIAPGTGAPLPGGLQLEQLDSLLGAVAGERTVVGVDLVEVAPERPGGMATQMAALYLLLRLCDRLHRRLKTDAAGPTSSRPRGKRKAVNLLKRTA